MPRCQCPIRTDSHRGLTLLEIVVATLITGVMLVVSLDSIGAVFQSNLANAGRLKGPGLAQELMAEIMSMAYMDPTASNTSLGTDAGESTVNRNDLDDVDDYDDLNSLGIRSKSSAAPHRLYHVAAAGQRRMGRDRHGTHLDPGRHGTQTHYGDDYLADWRSHATRWLPLQGRRAGTSSRLGHDRSDVPGSRIADWHRW